MLTLLLPFLKKARDREEDLGKEKNTVFICPKSNQVISQLKARLKSFMWHEAVDLTGKTAQQEKKLATKSDDLVPGSTGLKKGKN